MPPALPAFAAAALLALTMQAAPLRIVVIEGEDAVNIVQQKTAVAPVIEVRDRNDQPVAGAIVRFAIQQGRGTFAGARTLSVTTNAAGRAVAAGLTPTGSGALQIGATATFQGQTAVATIAQTNVMTAAQAGAAASGGGASGSTASGGAAGGGGSGGLSGTTLGIVGGAAAGGALAVSALGGSEESSGATTTTAYRASFSLHSVHNSVHTVNGVIAGHCTNQPVDVTGNITVTLDERGEGDIEMEWTQTTGPAGLCTGAAPRFHAREEIASAANIALAYNGSSDFQAPAGTVRQLNLARFTGALDAGSVNGMVTVWQEQTLIAPSGPGVVYTGGYPPESTRVTLTKQ